MPLLSCPLGAGGSGMGGVTVQLSTGAAQRGGGGGGGQAAERQPCPSAYGRGLFCKKQGFFPSKWKRGSSPGVRLSPGEAGGAGGGRGAGAAARRRSGQYLQHWCFQPFLPQSRFQVPCGGAVGAEEPGSCVCFEEDGGGARGGFVHSRGWKRCG